MISNISTQLPTLSPLKAGEHSSAVDGKGVVSTKTDIKPDEQQQAEVARLKKIDQEVKAHEAAHKNAGGQYAGSASFSYTVGPDGNRYAIGGEVAIDVAPVKDDPEATIAKLDVVIAAALAPAKPSAQDRKVAAAAVAARNQARAELAETRRAEQDQNVSNFDINDFGDTPVVSVNKAYENGSGLGENTNSTGKSFSLIS